MIQSYITRGHYNLLFISYILTCWTSNSDPFKYVPYKLATLIKLQMSKITSK